MSYRRRLRDVLLIYLEGALKLFKMSHKCLIEDDLQMPYQKMSCRCLVEDDLQMSYQKVSCMRCLKDVLYNLTMFYITYL